MSNQIRLSIGTAAQLELVHCKLDAPPTTAYTMTYTPSRCNANCAFCTQARGSSAKANQLSRVTWPSYPLDQFIEALSENSSPPPFGRLCIQTLQYPNLFKDLTELVTLFRRQFPLIPLSVALPPMKDQQFRTLHNLGVQRVAIPLDAVTPSLFDRIKGAGVNGPFSWNQHFHALKSALSIFGPQRTTTHLIIGLGETELETVHLIQELVNREITIGLFPFTPIIGTPLATLNRPPIDQYRRIQLAFYLLQKGIITAEQIRYDSSHRIIDFGLHKKSVLHFIKGGKPFQTAGCPSCNRPFFTERPRGPIYNFPMEPTEAALKEIKEQLTGVL